MIFPNFIHFANKNLPFCLISAAQHYFSSAEGIVPPLVRLLLPSPLADFFLDNFEGIFFSFLATLVRPQPRG